MCCSKSATFTTSKYFFCVIEKGFYVRISRPSAPKCLQKSEFLVQVTLIFACGWLISLARKKKNPNLNPSHCPPRGRRCRRRRRPPLSVSPPSATTGRRGRLLSPPPLPVMSPPPTTGSRRERDAATGERARGRVAVTCRWSRPQPAREAALPLPAAAPGCPAPVARRARYRP